MNFKYLGYQILILYLSFNVSNTIIVYKLKGSNVLNKIEKSFNLLY